MGCFFQGDFKVLCARTLKVLSLLTFRARAVLDHADIVANGLRSTDKLLNSNTRTAVPIVATLDSETHSAWSLYAMTFDNNKEPSCRILGLVLELVSLLGLG